MKVSLFATCLVDMFQGNAGKAAVELLERLGCEIDFPDAQVCCGQPAYNSGYVKESKEAMKRMITAFEHAEYVVSPSGSCAYMFQEYPHVFKGDSVWEPRAKKLAEKTYELTQFIVEVLNVDDVGAKLKGKATFHTSCHMTRLLGVREAPMRLLKNVKGLEFEELPGKEQCCGFGGTFSVKMAQISEQMVDEKVGHIEETEAEILIGADAGCLMNIGGRIGRQGKPIRVMHIAEVLNCR
ncbi:MULTISPECIES: (Fe-S)-binding protein [Cytobacillus]|jgi:L-lactate dehydrogenase complex protein LldE|uniref:Lactate utilization protein A n=2 Tax=Cytobacillus oceanisediminis TaxID=665099 RepID=A0A160M922_9BACI|nr:MULTISPECIES: (Fe-S)-binding protein [Cytobacillus]EFV79105.1 YvfV protein [Bacillus sp. 2_A_57_CT2]MBY0159509.1 (Fe-S)-binding protein [Cytobacillus firmus]AND39120.1 Fe-S oxidoreductase [Cytobacillus oceanisediminis 2691]MBU8733266.1 (Fe-S)-binding protein [Cytobacillus oceanisediminis]MBU8768266.1 (Fe-S)-binding protein [Cytobacillus oceanisediminis]